MKRAVPDTSVWIAFFREGKAEGYMRHALRTRRVLLASVVAYELYLGAATLEHKRDLDRIRRAFVTAGLVITPAFSDWCDAATLLERYARLKGALEAHRHLTYPGLKGRVSPRAVSVSTALATRIPRTITLTGNVVSGGDTPAEPLNNTMRTEVTPRRIARRLPVESTATTVGSALSN